MKNSNMADKTEITGKGKKLGEKTKTAFLSGWSWAKPFLKRNSDALLFIVALAVLTAALFHSFEKKISLTPLPTIVFTQWWQDDLEKNTLEELVKEFESLHEGINVVINTESYEELRQELFNPNRITSPEDSNSQEAEKPADVIALDPLWVPELLKNEIIEDTQDSNRTAPLLSFIDIFYYNVDLLKAANFTRPPKDRSEFLSYAKALTNRDEDRWALTMGGNSSRGIYDDVFPWIWSSGAQVITDGSPTVNSRAVTDTLSFLASLNKEGVIVPGALTADTNKKLEDFISGRAAFMIAPANYIKTIREQLGDKNFGVSTIPSPDNFSGKSYYATMGWTLGISSTSPHKDEARLFVDFLTDKAPYLSEKAKAISGNSSPYPGPDPLYSKVWDIAIAGESSQDFTGEEAQDTSLKTSTPGQITGLPWTEMGKIFQEELLNLFSEKTTPAEAASAIQKKWSEVIKY